MASKISDERLVASIATARKERASLDTRHERAKAVVASYDDDVREVDARLDYLGTIARQRGIDPAAAAPADDSPAVPA